MTGVQDIYDRLWRKATLRLESGGVRADPYLGMRPADPRRGITLVARPDAPVRERVGSFLNYAGVLCPGQHFYHAAELHVTVLAIFPGSATWRDEIRHWSAARQALDQVLKEARAFSVTFHGVTASPEAVLVQGFPRDNGLAQLRNALRSALRKAGVGQSLDRRYRITAAHLTVMRFARAQADWKSLLEYLRANRQQEFGETRFRSLELVWSDWYASRETTRILRQYTLQD